VSVDNLLSFDALHCFTGGSWRKSNSAKKNDLVYPSVDAVLY